MSYTGMIPYTLPSMLTAFKPDKETVLSQKSHPSPPAICVNAADKQRASVHTQQAQIGFTG